MKKTHIWTDENDKVVAESVFDNWLEQPPCPLCGKTTELWEGVVGQDLMGNDEYGWCNECPHCHISTAIIDGRYDDDNWIDPTY